MRDAAGARTERRPVDRLRYSAPVEKASTEPSLIIEPTSRWRGVDLPEVWRYRELLFFFVWRDVKVRYKQTVLGVAWAVVQPLASMAVFAFFFGRVAKLPSDGVPYSVFAYSALLPWTLFSSAVSNGGMSVLGNSHLITKVYFPRVLVPAAAVATVFVDFLVAAVMLLPLLALHRISPAPASLLWLPVATLITLLLAFGVSLWVSALVVRFRDLRHVVPFVLQMLMFATPIVYPLSMVPERWRGLVALNPMAGIVETFRAALFGREVPVIALAWALAMALVLIGTGGVYFRRLERMMADVI